MQINGNNLIFRTKKNTYTKLILMKISKKYFPKNLSLLCFFKGPISFLSSFIFFIAFSLPLSGQNNHHGSIFDRWDKNGDNKLQPSELPPKARPNFNKADSNSDGFISREEDHAFRKKLKNKSKPTAISQSDEVDLKQNIFYANNDNLRQTLDLLIPKKRKKEKLPIIVYIHGGAWKSGNKNQGIIHLSPFVESGHYVGATIGYRLSSESKWPSQIHDCKAAIRWLRGNAEEYGIDIEKIGAFGHSAGGHLVSMLGTSSGVKTLEGSLGQYTKESSQIHCVINLFGPSALLEMSKFPSRIDHDAADSPESQLIGGALQKNKEKAKLASPIHYVSKDDVPFLHIHGTKDQLVPFNQSVIFNQKLLKTGCNSTLITVQDGGHGGFKNDKIRTLSQKFFNKHLRGYQTKIQPLTIKE